MKLWGGCEPAPPPGAAGQPSVGGAGGQQAGVPRQPRPRLDPAPVRNGNIYKTDASKVWYESRWQEDDDELVRLLLSLENLKWWTMLTWET